MGVVGATYFGIKIWVDGELNGLLAQKIIIRELSEIEKYQLYLYEETIRNDLKHRDFVLLKAIIQCESSWRQFDKNGNLLISKGNQGLGQINKLAHEKTYNEMGLDIKNPYHNLKFTVFLYKRDGINPWEKWSGHCWQK